MIKLGNVKFGVNAVVAGQKCTTVNAAPQLIANSTVGKFVITAPVSKALGIAVGDNVMFLDNFQGVRDAVDARIPEIVEYAEQNSLNLDNAEDVDTIVNTFGHWFIAKGVKLFDKAGQKVMATERFTKEDKQKYLNAHKAEIVEANREVLVERAGDPDATDEQLAALLTIDDVTAPQYHAASGSKTATTGSGTGIGCQLNFTDTNIWNRIKEDLGDEDAKKSKNRAFDVLLDEGEESTYDNGYETVSITIYPLEFKEDTDPIVRSKKD